MKKYQILTNKKRLYRFTALGLGSAVALAAPVAIVIACGDDGSVQTSTNYLDTYEPSLKAEADKTTLDLASSTTDSLSWINPPQVPAATRGIVDRVEYALGRFELASEALTQATWTPTMPLVVPPAPAAPVVKEGETPPKTVPLKLWVKYILKPNAPLQTTTLPIISNLVFSSSADGFDKVKAAATPTARSADTAEIISALEKIAYASDSTRETIAWQNIPSLSPAQLANVARIDYVIGNYKTEDDASKAPATAWTSALPTSLFSAASPNLNVWARLVAKPGVTLSKTYADLTTKINLAALPAYSDDYTAKLQAFTDKLDLNLETSTTSDLVWTTTPQISTDETRTVVLNVEYAFYDKTLFATPEAAFASPTTNVSGALPASFPTGITKDNVRLLTVYKARPGQKPDSNNKFAFKTTILVATALEAKLKAVKDPSATTPEAKAFDTAALVTKIEQNLKINPVSSKDTINWASFPTLSAEEQKSVARIDYLFGPFSTESTLSDAKGWATSLPTGFFGFSSYSAWARIVPRPGVTLSKTYVNLTDLLKIDVLPDRALSKEALPAASVNYGTNWQSGDHSKVVFVTRSPQGFNDPIKDDIYTFTPGPWADLEEAEWNILNYSRRFTAFRQVRPQTDRTVYDKDTKRVAYAEASVSTRATKARFEFFDQVTLTKENGEKVVFDKDFSQNDIMSDDPRDINSANFTNTFYSTKENERIKNISFKLNANAAKTYWKKNITGENGDPIEIRDFLLGLMWSIFSTPRDRISYSGLSYTYSRGDGTPSSGSFKVVSDAIAEALKIPSDKRPVGLGEPNRTSAVPRPLFWESRLGVDTKFFQNALDPAAIKSILPDDQTFSLNIANTTTLTELRNFWEDFKAGWYIAVPYKATLALVERKDLSDQLETILHDPSKPEAERKLTAAEWTSFKNSLAYKMGYYHHFLAKREDFYTAGAYYLSEATKSSNTIAIKLNEGYIDERFLKQVNSKGASILVKEYRLNYVSETTNVQALINAYKNGTNIGQSPTKPLFSYLSGNEQIEARNTQPDGYGVKFARGFEALKGITAGTYSYLSAVPVVKGDFTPHYFNDNYAKVVYGKTGKELNNNKNLNADGSVVKSLASGEGFLFRKLLAAATNAYTVVKRGLPDALEKVYWPSIFPPEENIYGTDPDQKFGPANPLSVGKIANAGADATPNGVNEEGLAANYIFSREDEAIKEAGLVRHSSYIEQYSKGAGQNRFGAPETEKDGIIALNVIRAEIKKILDRVVGPLSPSETTVDTVSAAKKVIWEMPYNEGGVTEGQYASPMAQETYKALKAMFAQMDPRLNLVAAMKPSSQEDLSRPETYQEATVLLDTWPGNVTFNVTKSTIDTAGQFKDYWYDKRIPYLHRTPGAGYSVAAMRSFQTKRFAFDAPTEAFMWTWGYLQTGVLLLQSYYSDENEYAKWETPILKPVHKLTDIIKKIFNDFMSATTVEKLKKFGGISDSSKAEWFAETIRNLKFENWWKSDYRQIELQDYLAMSGLEEVVKLREELESKQAAGTLTEDEKKIQGVGATQSDFDGLMSYLNILYNGTISSDVWVELNKLNTKDLVDVLVAWQILAPENFNPLTSAIVDRTKLSTYLEKTWYFNPQTNGDSAKETIAQKRVDLDYEDNYYLGAPLFRDPNDPDGKYKTADKGGIIF